MKIDKETNISIDSDSNKEEATIKMQEQEPGTINQQQIDEWKKEYGKVFQTVIGSDIFIWRRVRRNEYIDAMTDSSLSEDSDRRIYERQELILKKVCLYPSPDEVNRLIEEEGCLATCLGNEIMDRSGFAIPITSTLS